MLGKRRGKKTSRFGVDFQNYLLYKTAPSIPDELRNILREIDRGLVKHKIDEDDAWLWYNPTLPANYKVVICETINVEVSHKCVQLVATSQQSSAKYEMRIDATSSLEERLLIAAIQIASSYLPPYFKFLVKDDYIVGYDPPWPVPPQPYGKPWSVPPVL